MYKLRVESGGDAGHVFALKEGENHVGRRHDVDCTVNDIYVSRLHCVVVVEGARAWLENRSEKGTFLDGEAVEGRVAVRERQRIRLGHGQTELSLVEVREERGVLANEELSRLSGFPTPSAPGALVEAAPAEPGAEPLSGFILGNEAPSVPAPAKPAARPAPRREEDDRDLKSGILLEPDSRSLAPGTAADDDVQSGFIDPKEFRAMASKPAEPEEAETRRDSDGVVEDLRRQEWRRYRLRQFMIGVYLLVILAALSAVVIWLTR